MFHRHPVGAGLLTRPPPVDCDARRARRLGAPPYRVLPCGASFFPRDGKETKGSPGETHIAVGNKFPPPPVRSPPAPRNLRGPNSRGLPVTVRRGRDNDCPRNRAAAAPKSRRPGQLDQTGAPDCSRSNLCGRRIGGRVRRPTPTLLHRMKPPSGGTSPYTEGRFWFLFCSPVSRWGTSGRWAR